MAETARRRRRRNLAAQTILPGVGPGPFRDEYAFQKEVKRLAKAHGWAIVTIPRTRGQRGDWGTYALPGWPDLFLIRPPQIVALELKMPGNKPTDSQLDMLAKLQGCVVPVEAYPVWPKDYDDIVTVLSEQPDPRVEAAHRRIAKMTDGELDRFVG
jgi:hypothetical protein